MVLRDPAPSHGHLVRVSEFFFIERNFHSLEDCFRHLEEFSALKENNVVGRRNGEIARMWQRVAGGNGEDIVQLCRWGTRKSVPVMVIASHGKKPRKLSARPLVGYVFHLLVSAAISCPFSGMTP